MDSLRRIDEMKFESENLSVDNRKLVDENQGLSSANSRLKVLLDEKEHDLSMAQANLASVTEMLEEKSQNSESVQQERLQNLAGSLIRNGSFLGLGYETENVLLSPAIKDLQVTVGTMKKERDEAKLRLSDKDRELTELRREVNNVIDKKRRLEQELERLRQHLLAVEDGYTQEALSTEDRERDLRKKLQGRAQFIVNRLNTILHTGLCRDSMCLLVMADSSPLPNHLFKLYQLWTVCR